MSFLKAHWKKLIMMNYEVHHDLLRSYLPYGTELDSFEGKHYVSLVGFLFDETRILGIPVPYHTKFEEINLRFYVKRWDGEKWKRGVVFIKEIVPRFMISAVANLIYNEHYECLPMSHVIQEKENRIQIQYYWGEHQMNVSAETQTTEMAPGSLEEFIAEHYWGYSKVSDRKTSEYEVAHPRWKIHKVHQYELHCDMEALYGKTFCVLNECTPASVLVAEGSVVEVKSRKLIIG